MVLVKRRQGSYDQKRLGGVLFVSYVGRIWRTTRLLGFSLSDLVHDIAINSVREHKRKIYFHQVHIPGDIRKCNEN